MGNPRRILCGNTSQQASKASKQHSHFLKKYLLCDSHHRVHNHQREFNINNHYVYSHHHTFADCLVFLASHCVAFSQCSHHQTQTKTTVVNFNCWWTNEFVNCTPRSFAHYACVENIWRFYLSCFSPLRNGIIHCYFFISRCEKLS